MSGGRYWGTWTIYPEVVAVLGNIALVFALYFFFSPIATAVKITRANSTLEFSAFTYMSTFVNCSLWVCYAFFQKLDSPLYTNLIGGAASVVWLMHFLVYASSQNRFKVCSRFIPTVLIEAAFVFFLRYYDAENFFRGQSRSVFIIGVLADIINIVMYASPLAVIGLVIRTKNVEYLPFLVCVGVLLCSSVWTTYGVYIGDIFITIPNAIGTFLAIFQLTLHIIYAGSRVGSLTDSLVDN